MTRKPKEISLKEAFVQEIEDRIFSGDLRPGDKLPSERELVHDMNVSLTVVTAGIADLEGKGFVDVIPRQGVFIADYVHKGSVDTLVSMMRYNNGTLSPRQIRSIVETRAALEQVAIEDFMRKATSTQMKHLGRYIERMSKEKDDVILVEDIQDFFHEMYAVSDNVLLPLIYHSFRPVGTQIYYQCIKVNTRNFVYECTKRQYELLLSGNMQAAKQWSHEYLYGVISGSTSIIK
jgi:GntR family transcriptional repressor for pyruvate dehydrogenase complex